MLLRKLRRPLLKQKRVGRSNMVNDNSNPVYNDKGYIINRVVVREELSNHLYHRPGLIKEPMSNHYSSAEKERAVLVLEKSYGGLN